MSWTDKKQVVRRPLNVPITPDVQERLVENGAARALDMAEQLAHSDDLSPAATAFFKEHQQLVGDSFVAALDIAVLGVALKPLKPLRERPKFDPAMNFQDLEVRLEASGDKLLEQLSDSKKLNAADQLRVHEMYQGLVTNLIEEMREALFQGVIGGQGR